MAPGALRTAYLELMMDEPGTEIAEFVRRAMRAEFGPCAADELVALLREIEVQTVASIHAQAEANPDLAGAVEDRVDEARAEIDALVRDVQRALGAGAAP